MKKISLSETAKALSAIIDGMDDKKDVRSLLNKEFPEALTDIETGIDRRKAMLREVESKIALARHLKEENARHVQRYESVKNNLIEQTKKLIEENPGIPFKDSLGKRLVVQRNARPRMLIENEALIPDEFCTMKKEVDKNLLMNAIESNRGLAERLGVTFEYGTQLRGFR